MFQSRNAILLPSLLSFTPEATAMVSERDAAAVHRNWIANRVFFLQVFVPIIQYHTFWGWHIQSLCGHVRTAHLKTGNPVALSPCVRPVLSSGLTVYLSVYLDRCTGLFSCMCVCFWQRVRATLTLSYTMETPEPSFPSSLPAPASHLPNNLTYSRHYGDDKGEDVHTQGCHGDHISTPPDRRS